MKKLGWFLLALFLALPLLAVAFVAGMRLVEPPPEQMAALQEMSQPVPPVRGRDASDAVWLLDYDLPPGAEAEAAAAVQVRVYNVWTPPPAGDPSAKPSPDPRKAWTKFPDEPAPEQGVCAEKHAGCLAYVEANRPLVAATLDEHARGLAKALAFARHDGLRIGVPQSVSSEFPRLNSRRRLVLTHFSYRFVSGERLGAVEELCGDIDGWRRIGADTDSAVVSMVAIGRVEDDVVLLAEMLAKLPKETELPAACTEALRPTSEHELDLCPAMRSEFQSLRKMPDSFDAGRTGWFRPSWQLDRRNYDAVLASSFARYCGPKPLALQLADQRTRFALPPPPKCPRLRRYADPVGCVLAEVAGPDREGWLDRRTDQAAMLALMRTIVWLRANAEGPDQVDAALARRPAELGLRRAPTYSRDKDTLSITLIEDWQDPEEFVLAAGAEPRPVKRRRSGNKRSASRGLAVE